MRFVSFRQKCWSLNARLSCSAHFSFPAFSGDVQIRPAGTIDQKKNVKTYAVVDAVQEVVQLLDAVLVGSVLDALGALLEVVLQWGAGRGLTASYYDIKKGSIEFSN